MILRCNVLSGAHIYLDGRLIILHGKYWPFLYYDQGVASLGQVLLETGNPCFDYII